LHWAKVEIDFAISSTRTTAGLELPVEEIDEAHQKLVVRYAPLGVTVGIVPWNYPILLCCAKLAPCLVTGNTLIVKPSPFTPYSGLKLVELAQKVFPPGVVQALSGDDRLGQWLTEHPGPAKITFTGSTATGKKVMQSASKTLKRVTLELSVFGILVSSSSGRLTGDVQWWK
jgi:acyl-CoA reductase-like NAD-dependent aldehyde dehydrogenase